jgi:two-component system sensor kinase FixL
MQALQEFAASTERLFNISCRFECESPVLVPDVAVADHLYRIAQEAVGNAVKHGRASTIVITLDMSDAGTFLRVEDDGVGIAKVPPRSGGMGLRIMAQRAKLIGAAFDIQSSARGGTAVACCLPHAAI